MEAYQQVAKKLQELGITYDVVEHPPAFTTEQADSYIEGLEGVRTKTMFLTNKKKTQYYLLIMDDQKPLDMDDFKEQVGANRIRMASTESLAERMQLPAGTVSPFGLLNNEEKDILVYFDQDIVSEEIMTFHPNTNEKTIFIKTQDLFRFLESIGFNYEILNLP
jgi:YbaK/prolyl-tRNA synthetase-associated domain protein